MARMTGAELHLKRMRKLTTGMRQEASKLIYVLADMHATEAAISITTGAVSGAGHIPSKPGEPPNSDTHMLDRSIHVERTGPLKAKAIADAPYAARLEFGDEVIKERPYMRPAAKKVRKAAEALLAKGVSKIVKGGKL